MQALAPFWQQADTVGRAVALMLLMMSISTWAVIFWKAWLLARARRDLRVGTVAFWRAADLASARSALQALDRDGVLLPLVDAVQVPEAPGTLATRAMPEAQLTRRLRDSLQGVLLRLQAGQVLLASVGAVSPFVGCSARYGASFMPCRPSAARVRLVWIKLPAPWARRLS